VTVVADLLDRIGPVAAPSKGAAEARAWLDRHGLPDRRDEAWRYTPVPAVVEALAETPPSDAGPVPSGAVPAAIAIDRDLVDRRAGRPDGPRLVVVDGRLAAPLSDLDALPAAVRVGPAGGAPGAPPADGFEALGRVVGGGAVAVDVGPGGDRRLHVVHVATGRSGGAHPALSLHVSAGAAFELIETFVGVGAAAVVNAATRVTAEDGATVGLVRVVAEDDESVHVGRTAVALGRGATLLGTSVLVGGRIARHALDVDAAAPGSHVDVAGLAVPRHHDRHDTVVTVDHAGDDVRSGQIFRVIAADRGRGSFSGHVIVRPGTVGTDADQSSRALLLGPDAQADSRPWLEIFADDVRCTHGATVGRLDDDALFYLRSRGIPAAEARRLLVAAFAAEVVDRIGDTGTREWVEARVRARTVGAG